MNPTRGKVMLSEGKYIDSQDGWIAEVTSCPTSPVKQVPEGSEKHKANGALFVAAWNACVEINPENPIAAAEAMPEIFRLLQDAVCDALKVSHGKLDPEKWLTEASAAVARAMWKE